MPGSVPLQLVAVRDIGVVAAALLVDPSVIDGDAIEIAGAVLTGAEIADQVGAHLGLPGRYETVPLEVFKDDADRRAMFRWLVDTPAYRADFASTRAVDPSVLDFATWLKE